MPLDLAVVLRKRRADGIASRIVGPVALRHGPPHHRRNSLTHAPRGLGLRAPNRHENGHDVGRGDVRDGALAEVRKHIASKRGSPLGGMLLVSPSVPVEINDGCGRSFEGRDSGRAAALSDRVATGTRDLAVLQRGLPRFGERDERASTQPERALPPVHDEPLSPPPGARRVNFQEEPVAVVVATWLGGLAHEGRAQPLLGVPARRFSTVRHAVHSLYHSLNKTGL